MRKLSRILLIFLLFAACSNQPMKFERIYIKGSDTMLLLTELLAEEYMKTHPGVSIYVNGGGTESGVRALIDGRCQICTASRKLTPNEIQSIADKYGAVGISYLIAKDALSIYINPDNPVSNLTKDELAGIFSCSIENWEEVGGMDAMIDLVLRPPNSGTYVYFREHILDDMNYCEDAMVKPTTEAVIEEVSSNISAIGYGGVGYNHSVVHVAINGFDPTHRNIRDDNYPITRYLQFYTINTAKGEVKDFIDWTLSPEGQKNILKAGFISLWDISY